MGLDISFRRISLLVVIGLILLTASALANAGAGLGLAYPYTQVTEVAKVPVTYDPIKGVGVQTITKTCAAANSCIYKPAVQTIARGASGLGRFVRVATNPYLTVAMLTAGWAYDKISEQWQKDITCWHPDYNPAECVAVANILKHYSESRTPPGSGYYYNLDKSYVVDTGQYSKEAVLAWFYNGKLMTYTSRIYRKGKVTPIPATEQDVFDALSAAPNQHDSWQIATADGQALNPWKDIFPDAAPATQPDPVPEVSPSDASLLDLLRRGLLQTIDPLAPYYVAPAELARLQSLQQQLDDALNQKAEEALQAMKQPITQQQYDESNARDRAEFANALPDPNFLPDSEEHFNSEIDIINETPELPTGPDLTNLWSFSTGTCNGFTLPASVAGRSYSITVDKQCDYYPEFNAALNFMLYLLTAFQIFNIYHRAMLRG